MQGCDPGPKRTHRGRGRENEQLETVKGEKERDVHPYRPCVDLQVYSKKEESLHVFEQFRAFKSHRNILTFYYVNFLFNSLYILHTVFYLCKLC